MSMVTAKEVVAVLTEARESYAALAAEVATAKDAIKSESSPEAFKAFFVKHAELGRRGLRLSLLEKWAANQGVEVAA